MNMLPLHWPTESDWTLPLADAFATESFQALQQFVAEEQIGQIVYPPPEDVFNAFRWTPFSRTKVVILGQDPYHGIGQAHGLSFSVSASTKLPPSLKNIFKELASDLDVPLPTCGNLSGWAEEGVLLLNTVLTVRAGEANSHANRGWELFTDRVIELLGRRTDRSIVFLLWGKPAEKKSILIADHHRCLSSPHPSPLSAHRGFFSSRPFSAANEALRQSGQTPINWLRGLSDDIDC